MFQSPALSTPSAVVCKQKNRNMRRLLIILILLIPFYSKSQDIKIKECFIDSCANKKYCIASDKLTFHNKFGDSYRLFIIKSIEKDSTLNKIYLDINRSPDFAYSIISEYYKFHNLVIIKGYAMIYLYNSDSNIISEKIIPDYSKCEFSDGQGSIIRDIKIIDNGKILELKIDECGIHKFDIQNMENIKEIN